VGGNYRIGSKSVTSALLASQVVAPNTRAHLGCPCTHAILVSLTVTCCAALRHSDHPRTASADIDTLCLLQHLNPIASEQVGLRLSSWIVYCAYILADGARTRSTTSTSFRHDRLVTIHHALCTMLTITDAPYA
jgi:hypothetical protein